MEITYVTFFYDIGRKSQDPTNKFDSYFPNIEKLLQLIEKCDNCHLLFFTTQNLMDQIRQNFHQNLHGDSNSRNFVHQNLRGDSTTQNFVHQNSKIKFIITDKYFGEEDINLITYIYNLQNYQTNNPTKDTPEFIALTLGKFLAIKKAIQLNPFGSKYYGWIDAGLLKVAQNSELLNDIIPSEKIKLMILDNINYDETLDINFVKKCQYKIAGGFFLGNKDNMLKFCNLIINEKFMLMYNNRIGLEQEIMTIIYLKHTDLFNPYYGAFTDLFINYNKMINNKNLGYKILNTSSATDLSTSNSISCSNFYNLSKQHIQNYMNKS